MAAHPYEELPEHHYWRRQVTGRSIETIDYDSKADPRPFKLAVTGFRDVIATRDGETVSLTAELPAGKYQVKVKGKVK